MKKPTIAIGSVVASMIAAIALATMLDGAQPTVSNISTFLGSVFFHEITLTIPTATIMVVILVAIALVTFYGKKTLVDVKHKNDDALLVNIKLLSEISKQDSPLLIKSTRFSEWTHQNSKSTTRSFRTLLSQVSADENHEIQRLWVVRSREDYNQLLLIANTYEGHSSTSIKYIDLENCPNLIEAFIIGNRVATIGVPTGRHGATIGLSIKTSNPEVIGSLHSYFDILYRNAKFALDKGVLKINSRRPKNTN